MNKFKRMVRNFARKRSSLINRFFFASSPHLEHSSGTCKKFRIEAGAILHLGCGPCETIPRSDVVADIHGLLAGRLSLRFVKLVALTIAKQRAMLHVEYSCWLNNSQQLTSSHFLLHIIVAITERNNAICV